MARKLFVELLGTLLLVASIVGAGIAVHGLSDGDPAATVFGVAIASGIMLGTCILIFEPISGGHFNPAVTLCFALRKDLDAGSAALYVVAQLVGAVLGVMLAHLMFGNPLIEISGTSRGGGGLLVGEFVSTFGLIAVILCCVKHRPGVVPFAVGVYVFASQLFIASGAFSNPAVTLSRIFTDTFTGIELTSAIGFAVAQLIGAAVAVYVFRWLHEDKAE